jgi:hypothetical protein
MALFMANMKALCHQPIICKGIFAVKKYLLAIAALILVIPGQAFAVDQAAAEKIIKEKISVWLNSPEVINAIKMQNEKNAALTDAEITALDEKWKAGDATLLDSVLKNALSAYLKDIVAKGGGLYTEIFVMDSKGLNVGQSDKTSDYWQGDEPKWQKTYKIGANAIDISEVELDESTQTYQVQISTTVTDGGAAIGAVTVGLDAEQVK